VIRRIWRAWATTEKASAYEALLRDEVFVNIKKRGIEGFRNVHLLRRDHADDVEFVILMTNKVKELNKDEEIKEAFDVLDKEKDQYITAGELKYFMRKVAHIKLSS
jgi:hypothetical protein